ncbi:hypothetical protein LOAG_17778 [Loa loa]|uniref:HECT domain-containing protein n=1 Tax=Loa loa TaxID=7209 RepID=A0A1I7VUA5_LOALO|nr:hypothetical protein LOAG_17778 [Loa loa]EJD75005.1 hypothetical protein LOAG_17778 [Loa loa]
MAQLYSNYTVLGSASQQQYSSHLIVQCPNCTSRFYLSPATFTYPQRWPQNFIYPQGSYFQYIQPFIRHPTPQTAMQSAFHPPNPSSCYVFGVNQNQKVTDSTNNTKQYVSQHAVGMSDMLVRRIRDILIDILNSDICKYGVTICQLMVLLKQSCANCSIILLPSITDDFKGFLRYEMTDYVEIEDDLCRYRRATLSIQEENIPSSSVCERTSDRSKTCPATLALQKCCMTTTTATNGSYSTKKEEKLISEKEEVKESTVCKSAEESSYNFIKFCNDKSKQFFARKEEHRRNDGADKRPVAVPIVLAEDKKCNIPQVRSDAISEYSYMRSDLSKIMEQWEEIFTGDLKELIRYLQMVDDYFKENDGKFTLSGFKEVFGELNKRWEFCDIDSLEMGIINVVHGIGLNEEPVLVVNPVIREIKFPEVAELAKKIYNLLSKLLQSVNSVEIELIVRAVNFGINDKKTMDEKYALLWEVLSDSQFQDVFVVDVLRRQYEEPGFDVMIRLNPNLNLPRIFAE